MDTQGDAHRERLLPLLEAALRSDDLRTWSAGILTINGRRLDDRLKGGAVLALEAYLMQYSDLPGAAASPALLEAFGDAVAAVCGDHARSLRESYNAVAWLLDAWRQLADAPALADEAAAVLPACAAVGTGIHAAAFLAVEDGAKVLMHLAGSPLSPVREAAVRGLSRMLLADWPHTVYELRRYAHIGDAWQHRAAAAAAADAVTRLPLPVARECVFDALDLHHTILAAYRARSDAARGKPGAVALRESLPETLRVLLLAERRAGFAAAQVWLAWDDPDVAAIMRACVAEPPLAAFAEAAALRLRFEN